MSHQNRFTCTGMRLYQCIQCRRKFSKFMDLTRHALKIHQSLRPFELGQIGDSRRPGLNCHLCNRQFSSKTSLRQHMRLHTDTKCYLCPHCHSVFHNPSLRKRHMASQCLLKTDVVETMACSSLLNQFESTVSYSNIKQLNETYVSRNPSDLSLQLSSHQKYAPITSDSCCVCSNKLESCNKCMIHLDIIKCLNEEKTDDLFPSEDLISNSYQFNENNSKSNIMQSCVEQEKQNVIPTNGSGFDDCEMNQLFKCTTCNKVFTKHASLIRHERIHTLDRPYHCPYCSMKFTQSFSLKVHELIHTNEKPHSCSYCDLKFRQRCNMKRHVKRVHFMDIE